LERKMCLASRRLYMLHLASHLQSTNQIVTNSSFRGVYTLANNWPSDPNGRAQLGLNVAFNTRINDNKNTSHYSIGTIPPTGSVQPISTSSVGSGIPIYGTPVTSGVPFQYFVDKGWISSRLLKHIPYEYCTEAQAETIKPILDGFDL
jgi:hypothetical protein